MATSVNTTFLNTKVFLITAMAFALALLHILVVFVFNPNTPRPAAAGGVETPASLNALVSGCGGYFHWETTASQALVIPADQADTAHIIPETQQIVPVYGYMAEEGLPHLGFWDAMDEDLPSREEAMRHLYDGGKVIWYMDTMDPADKQLLKTFVEEREAERIVALPWESDRLLPSDRQVAFSVWGASQSCTFWDEIAYEEFQEFTTELNLARPNLTVVDVPSNGVLPQLPGSPTGSRQ